MNDNFYDLPQRLHIAMNCTSDLSFLRSVLDQRKTVAEMYFKASTQNTEEEYLRLFRYFYGQIKTILGLE